jgi:hypothetical protein
MQDIGVTNRKIGIGLIARSSLIGLTCGLAYELTGYLLQFAWDCMDVHGGPASQVRFLQAFMIVLLMVAVAGFLPAMFFRISSSELTVASVTGAVAGIFIGIILVLFDYMQHFNYFADRAFSFSQIGYVLNIIAISPQFVLLVTAACAIIASLSALIYVKVDLKIG